MPGFLSPFTSYTLHVQLLMGVFNFSKPCLPENKLDDDSVFWSDENPHLHTYTTTWYVAGGFALFAIVVSIFTVLQHCIAYTNRKEQRQILRILYLPPIYAILSFVSYRWFLDYTYFELAKSIYEAITITAFMFLLLEYDAANIPTSNEFAIKVKMPLMSCFRNKPTRAYFVHTVKWFVLQYAILSPLCSIIGIICEWKDVYCQTAGFNPRYASIWISIINSISVSIALYGLAVFYFATKAELENRRPLSKFLCIKLIVFIGFVQGIVFKILQGKVIHETEYLTEINVSNGLNSLLYCIEMALFSILFWWAYPSREYRTPGAEWYGAFVALFDSINPTDVILGMISSIGFLFGSASKNKGRGYGHLAGDSVDYNHKQKVYPQQTHELEGGSVPPSYNPSTQNLMQMENPYQNRGV
ncbi:organic solute transporter Ostalpha-domain-containing protein [Flagelloscypha sp. PMI_526]|nr:organic solute transporter Ostalpha-domain-containing protein [Flagelloscypha sp. PMI_526]